MVWGESIGNYRNTQMVRPIDCLKFVGVEFWILSLSFYSLSLVATQVHGNNLPLCKTIVNSSHKCPSSFKVSLFTLKLCLEIWGLVLIYWGATKLVLKTFENAYQGCLNLPCLAFQSLGCICVCNWGEKGNTRFFLLCCVELKMKSIDKATNQ